MDVRLSDPAPPEPGTPLTPSPSPPERRGGPEGKRSKNRASPLSPTIFLRRNAGKTLPLVAVIMLAVLLVTSIIALIDSIPYSVRTIYDYSKGWTALTPRGDPTALPGMMAEVREHSPYAVERMAIGRNSSAQVHSIVGKWPYTMFGFSRDDLVYYLAREGSRGLRGRLPAPGEPEAVVSRPVAKNLGLSLGSVLQRPDDIDAYSPRPVRVVGIADTDRWLMVGSIETMRKDYFPPIDFALAFAKNPLEQAKLGDWMTARFKGRRALVFSYRKVQEESDTMFETLFKILNVVIGTLVVIITVMMAMLINIYQSQRLVEFGLLQAVGYTKRQILTRVLLETVLVIAGGWALGLALAVGALNVADALLMQPKAFALQIFDPKAYAYTVPLPVCILLVAITSVVLRFRRFDPVGVVERRLV